MDRPPLRLSRSGGPASWRPRARTTQERVWRLPLLDETNGLRHAVRPALTAPWDDDQERNGKRLLLGKGAVLAHRLAHALGAESNDKRQAQSPPCRASHAPKRTRTSTWLSRTRPSTLCGKV